ncbi:MAG: TerC family protein [Deltaproteobacteria bacterium]|nr:TerC family protein [Deltaproteobacteria bacterium]
MTSVASPLVWALFAGVILSILAVDLGVFNRTAHKVTLKAASIWVLVWVGFAVAFNAFVFYRFGSTRGLNFLQAYLLEQALSVDNVFVFILVFSYFRVPEQYQHRVLFWGVVGAAITRGIFVVAGVALLSRFHWLMYGLGLFLVVTAVKMLLQKDEDLDPSKNAVLRLFRRLVPMTETYEGAKFVVRRQGRRLATPLLAVLVVVEATDVMFAVDSIPAVFGVTQDVFIVYTSNIFAILGLRSLFFLLVGLVEKLHLLKHGVALILAFVGMKILLAGVVPISEGLSLAILAGILILATIASFVFPAKAKPTAGPTDGSDTPASGPS